jgi:hypothetical protein
MNHQTYEEWVLTPEYLSPEEQQALQAHQQQCESCRQLTKNWLRAESLLTASAPAAPAPGFTVRFAASLEQRKAKERKRQVRKILLILSLILVIGMAVVSAIYYSTNSPAIIIERLFKAGAQFVTVWESLKTMANSISKVTPAVLLLPGLILGSIVAAGITCVWLATIWKFSLSGGKNR